MNAPLGNTTPPCASRLSLPQLQEDFLALQPRLLQHARVAFRGIRCRQQRDDCTAEMIGLCWKWLLSLVRRGKDPRRFVSTLASYAAHAVWSGRRVCGQEKSRDALSGLAQRRHGFRVESLPLAPRAPHEEVAGPAGQRRADAFEERLRDNRQTPVPEQVAFRLDFPRWLLTRSWRDRRIVEDMACDEPTKALAQKYGLSAGRISQLRRQLYSDWRRFCAEDAAPSA